MQLQKLGLQETRFGDYPLKHNRCHPELVEGSFKPENLNHPSTSSG